MKVAIESRNVGMTPRWKKEMRRGWAISSEAVRISPTDE